MKPNVFVHEWCWGDENHNSGRMTVIMTYKDGRQSQKTFNFVIGEIVDIHGYSYEVSLDYSGCPFVS